MGVNIKATGESKLRDNPVFDLHFLIFWKLGVEAEVKDHHMIIMEY